MFIIKQFINSYYDIPEEILSFNGKNAFLKKETALEKMWQRFETHVFGKSGFSTDFMEDRKFRFDYNDGDNGFITIYDSKDNIAYKLSLIKLQVNEE